jgi:hypothetical protein
LLATGVFSGLTLGLLSFDTTHLEVLLRSGKPADQKNAARIAPLVKRHHLLLVTLLVGVIYASRFPLHTAALLPPSARRS